MPQVLTRQQVREVDRRAIDEFGMTGLVLMENAGRGAADLLCQLGIAGPVVICCGKGNNGGDGFVIARHLEARGQRVVVLLLADPSELTGDAAANFAILSKSDVPIEVFTDPIAPEQLDQRFRGADWIVDALLGTGSQGPPRPPLDLVIERANASGARILAVDLPSGLDCDTGEAATPTIRAQHTCTFVAAKPGFLVPGAKAYTGEVHVLNIGVPGRLIRELLDLR